MEFNEFKKELEYIFEKNSLSELLTEEREQKLYDLTQIMLEVNKSMNLTAITDEKAVILKHYADSLTVSKYIPNGSKIIDVGCGAGFPCLPLAIFRNDIAITALDATAKRIKYVQETAEKLKLNNVFAVAARAEEFAKLTEHREKYDIATARAVAALPILSELCLPFVKKGGKFIAMKAAQGETETADAANAIKLCGGSILSVDKFALISDNEPDTRVIISVSKDTSTPQKYPRHYSQIVKKHL